MKLWYPQSKANISPFPEGSLVSLIRGANPKALWWALRGGQRCNQCLYVGIWGAHAQGCLASRGAGSTVARSPCHIPTWPGLGEERPPEEQQSIELPYLSRVGEAER